MRVFYLSRSYLPTVTGGTLVRNAQVTQMRKYGYDVTVVVPDYSSTDAAMCKNIVRIPYCQREPTMMQLERYGIVEDYLDPWVWKAYKYLGNILTPNDIIFATSGGELGIVKLGSLLEKKTGARFIINLHDPVDYTLVNGMLIDDKFHVSREQQEQKYFANAEWITTTSEANARSLKDKYPQYKDKIVNIYFGYLSTLQRDRVSASDDRNYLSIVYGGNFGPLQSPDILAKACDSIKGVNLYFVGNYKDYYPMKRYLGKHYFMPMMPYEEYVKFCIRNIDLGFVSLTSEYLGACVPSKIYEYINMGLPMIGALPQGDARDIVAKYGESRHYSDIRGIQDVIVRMKEKEYINHYKERIFQERNKWSMEENIKGMIALFRTSSSLPLRSARR